MIDLDIVEDFFEAANELYPKKNDKPHKKHKKKSHKKHQAAESPDENDNNEAAGGEAAPQTPEVSDTTANGHVTPENAAEQRANSAASVEVVTADVHHEPR